MSKKVTAVRRGLGKGFLAVTATCIILLLMQSSSPALEIGSLPPELTLDNLRGNLITPSFPSKSELLIIYFFDASDPSIETLVQLHEIAQSTSGALSLIAVSRENPKNLSAILKGQPVPETMVLADNKGVTSAYGLSRKLPAAVLLGPGGVVCTVIAPVDAARQMVMAALDAFISMGSPATAEKIFDALPEQWRNEPKLKLSKAYASILTGDFDTANRLLDSLPQGSAAAKSESQAARGFLLLQEGRDEEALAACGQASKNAFASYVTGMLAARAGRCKPATASFKKAAEGKFTFAWQRALALNMAARTAEAENDDETALRLYKQAFALAPLDGTIGANLLSYYWRIQNFPAGTAYTSVLRVTNDAASPPVLFVNEFESEIRFKKDTRAVEKVKKQMEGASGRKANPAGGPHRMPRSVLVSDFVIQDCTPGSSWMPVALASLLRRNIEAAGNFTAIQRPEMLAAAEYIHLSNEELADPLRLADISLALSGDLLAFGEVGNYKGAYYLNIRIAEVASGEILAVMSEKLASLDELPPAVKRTAGPLIKEVIDHYARH